MMPGSSSGVEPTANSFKATCPILKDVLRLKEEQNALRKERARLAQELKNAERRRKRLKQRAKLLTDTELLQVMNLRRDEKDCAVSKKLKKEDRADGSLEEGASPGASGSVAVSVTPAGLPESLLPQAAEGEALDTVLGDDERSEHAED